MDTVLQLSQRQRIELFEQTAQQTGIQAVIVEKDFWVCWTLKELFQLPQIGEHLIFKGGTSHEAAKGQLRIVPPEHRLKSLRDDYTNMQQMFFGKPPSFEQIINLLREWESEFNQH